MTTLLNTPAQYANRMTHNQALSLASEVKHLLKSQGAVNAELKQEED